MTYQATLPRILRFGGGSSQELPEVLTTLGLSKPFIVTDQFIQESGKLARLTDCLKNAGFAARCFSETEPEPSTVAIEKALDVLLQQDHDCVIGFGGGSPIDTAKAIAVMAVHKGVCSDYKVPHIQDEAGLPIVAIPTTAGTGSEATRFTIITDNSNDEKMLCMGQAYMPIAALVDFELTLTMPARLTADTGIDALTHAIEAYVSKKANPFSDIYALAAMRSIAPNLRRACEEPEDHIAREAMMMGATFAGIAFSNSSVALVHGMSRPIGAHFHVPHGLSNAMLLPTVTQFSAPSALSRYADCAREMKISSKEIGDQAAVSELIEELIKLNDDLEVPSPEDYGIDKEEWFSLVPLMAEQAIASGSPRNNPINPTIDKIEDLYRQIWAL